MKIYCFDYDLWTFCVKSYKLEYPSSSFYAIFIYYNDNFFFLMLLFFQSALQNPSPDSFDNEGPKGNGKKTAGKTAPAKVAAKKKKRDPNEPQK